MTEEAEVLTLHKSEPHCGVDQAFGVCMKPKEEAVNPAWKFRSFRL